MAAIESGPCEYHIKRQREEDGEEARMEARSTRADLEESFKIEAIGIVDDAETRERREIATVEVLEGQELPFL